MTAIEYALRVGFLFVVGILMVYFALWAVASRWTLQPLRKRFKPSAIAFMAVSLVIVMFLIGLGVGFAIYNSLDKTAMNATPDEATATADEASTEPEKFDIVFPGSNLHVKTTVDAYTNDDDSLIVPFNDGFIMLSGYDYDGSYDDLAEGFKEPLKKQLSTMFTVDKDIVSATKGSLSVKMNDKDSISVKGYKYSGLISSKEYPSMSVSGVCFFDDENGRVYALTGFVGDSNNTAVVSMEYILQDIVSSMEIKK